MIYLSLPLLCNNSKFNQAFKQFTLYHQDKLLFPMYIDSVYGAFPYSLWNGGINSNSGKDFLYQNLDDFINESEIPIRLDCSNLLINNTDLYDRHQNIILKLLESQGNMIDIADLQLYNYIEEKYKNFNYTISNHANLIHPFTENIINGFLANDKIVLLTLSNINDLDLQLIKLKSKVELIVSNPCQYCSIEEQNNCISKEQYNQNMFSIKSIHEDCLQRTNIYNSNLLNKEINYYTKMGIHHFKIATPNQCLIEQFNQFLIFNLVKPEYCHFCLSYINNLTKESK